MRTSVLPLHHYELTQYNYDDWSKSEIFLVKPGKESGNIFSPENNRRDVAPRAQLIMKKDKLKNKMQSRMIWNYQVFLRENFKSYSDYNWGQ